ncbi:MAG: acetylesterase [Lachnospiraceae bacterium]|nr:acetylesterase [Lachnospiraceae bacterium]
MAFLTVNFISKNLMRTVPVNVILPADKLVFPGMPEPEQKPFKLLILLHGVLGNYTDWVNGTRIQRWAEEKNLCVVMPSGDNAFYVDIPESGNYYGKFIGEELPAMMRKMFHISERREDCYIAGLSMGGFGAMRNGLCYPETFGAIAALSSAFILHEPKSDDEEIGRMGIEKYCFGTMKEAWYSVKNPQYLAKGLAERKAAGEAVSFPKIYMCCGTEDGLIGPNHTVRDDLIEKGFDVTWEEGPGGHEWDFWDTYIRKILDWLPLDEDSAGINSGNVAKPE